MNLEKQLMLAEEITGNCPKERIKGAKMDFIGTTMIKNKIYYLFHCYACNGQHKFDEIRNLKIKYNGKVGWL